MATTTKTVFLTDENGNLLVDSNGRPRALTFTVIEGKSLRLAERETIPTVTYAELKTYSESVQTYTGITNTARFSVEDVALFQYIVSDRGNTRAYITAQVSAVNDTSLTANGIGISVAGADGKNGNDGVTPRIGDNKHWYIGEEDTGILAEGKDGATPEIGENGNWYINGEDTGKSSKGAKGDDGKSVTSATAGTVSEADGYTVTPVTFGLSDGSSLPAVEIRAKNGSISTTIISFTNGQRLAEAFLPYYSLFSQKKIIGAQWSEQAMFDIAYTHNDQTVENKMGVFVGAPSAMGDVINIPCVVIPTDMESSNAPLYGGATLNLQYLDEAGTQRYVINTFEYSLTFDEFMDIVQSEYTASGSYTLTIYWED